MAVSEQEELDQLAQRFLTLAGAEFQSLPLYDALARGMAIRPDLLRHLLAARPGQRRPNLMLAALHDLALRNPESDCGLLFPTCGGSVGAVGQQGTRIDPVRAAADLIDAHTEDFEGLIATRSIQTNEPNRSALWMLASRWAAADLPKVPVSVVELGASGGINLLFDHYHCQFGQDHLGDPAASVRLSCELSGNAPSLLSLPAPDIASRVGIDIKPVDLSDPNERRWLKACVWPEQTLRHERFDAAADAVSRTPPKVVRDDLVDGLSDLIDDLPHDSHLLVLNSWVLTYVERSRRAALLPILSLAAKDRPVTWVSAEAQGVVEWVPTPDSFDTQAEHLAESRGDTVIGVSTWRNGVQSVALGGHCHGHCAWVDWKLDAPLGTSGALNSMARHDDCCHPPTALEPPAPRNNSAHLDPWMRSSHRDQPGEGYRAFDNRSLGHVPHSRSLDNDALDNRCLDNRCIDNRCLDNRCLDNRSLGHVHCSRSPTNGSGEPQADYDTGTQGTGSARPCSAHASPTPNGGGSRVVVIDPGHNGANAAHTKEINTLVDAGGFKKACNTTGTASGSYSEAQFNWEVAQLVRDRLQSQGVAVVMTRQNNDGWGPCVDRRGAIASENNAALLLSIHADGSSEGNRGFHVIHPNSIAGYTDATVEPSKRLAIHARDELLGAGFSTSNYIGSNGLSQRSDLGTLNRAGVPAIIVECGNMKDSADIERLRSPEGQQALADALSSAIVSYLAT